jgi:hypothetical protein
VGPYAGAAFAVLFVAPFADLRRPFRLLHLDLAALLAFGVSHAFLNREQLGVSVPLSYAVLAYLLGRMLFAGFRAEERNERLIPMVPATWLVIGIVLLAGARVGLDATRSDVGDVGYATVVGADRIEHGQGLYGGDFPRLRRPSGDGRLKFWKNPGDVYGPATYLAYVPFELAFPWHDDWREPSAARAAAVTFDLLTALVLFLIGRRMRGRLLGLALAFAWLSYPYTLFPLMLNTNDQLIALLVASAFLALQSAPARGAALALGAAVKAAPLALAPLFATGDGERSLRRALVFTASFLVVLVLLIAPFVPSGGLHELYDRTLGFQAERHASRWTLWSHAPGLDWLRTVVRAGAICLALVVGWLPRRRTGVQVAALGAAVLIAVELGLNHWFYTYIEWFAPLALVALMAPYSAASRRWPQAGPDGA